MGADDHAGASVLQAHSSWSSFFDFLVAEDLVGKGSKTRAIPIEGALETVLEVYLATRRARFPRHDLGHPATPLFVDVRGRRLSVDQVKYLIERLYVRAGLRARLPASTRPWLKGP